LVFSSTAEGNFGFGGLFLKRMPPKVLLGFTAMIEVEKAMKNFGFPCPTWYFSCARIKKRFYYLKMRINSS